MTTDYNKTGRLSPTTRKLTGLNSRKTQSPLSLIRLPYPPTYTLSTKLTQRDNIRRANSCDQALKLLNEEITSDIQKHKQNLWKEHLDAHWYHSHNTYIIRKTIHGLSNRAPPPTLNIQQQNSNHTQTRCELFYQTIHKHVTHKTNRSINGETHKIQGYNITLTTTQVQEAIKPSKHNNSQGPDKPKHIGPLGLAFLTSMLKTALNTNVIPHIWRLANIVPPSQKPNKDIDRPISLLSVIAKTPMQHGYETQHFTVTALHTLNSTVTNGFNQMAPPCTNNQCSTVINKVFDTINIYTLIRKLLHIKISGTVIKSIANYIKGRKAYITYRHHTSSQRQFKTGFPQGGVLSPTLFNIYTADIPPPRAPVQVMDYADDITITSTHTSTSAAKK